MSDKLTIYYSVENCGDGSAYPRLFDTEELAEWHQDHLTEGWGESCTGKIFVKGNDLICEELQCAAGYYLTLLLEGYGNNTEIDEFKEAFFVDGLPKFTVDIIETHYYGVFVEGRLVYEKFASREKKTSKKGVEELTKIVNT